MRIALLYLTFALTAADASAQVANGGFESPSDEPPALGQWQYIGGALRETSNPHSGAYAARLENLSEAANVHVFQQTEAGTVTAGTQYELSFWAQAEYGVSGIGQVQLSFLNADGNLLPGSPQFFNIPTSAAYASYSQNLVAPENASALYLGFNSVTGAVAGATSLLVIDDVLFGSSSGFAPADFNQDSFVNGLDLAAWTGAFGLSDAADADNDNDSDGADFLVWQRSMASAVEIAVAHVPEPCSLALAVGAAGLFGKRRRRSTAL
jgi:hypothetical protein